MRSTDQFFLLKSWGTDREKWLRSNEALSEISSLDELYFVNPWQQYQWQELLETEQRYLLTFLKRRGEIIAFTLFLYGPHEKLAHLLKILVLPELRKQNIGRELWDNAQEVLIGLGAEKVYLEVHKKNAAANCFYKTLGFSFLNEVKHFYGAGQSALTYHLQLEVFTQGDSLQ